MCEDACGIPSTSECHDFDGEDVSEDRCLDLCLSEHAEGDDDACGEDARHRRWSMTVV